MVDSNPGLTAKLEEEANRTAIFHNFSSKPFDGYWNGRKRTFQPGDRKFMPKYLAEHYAKHLVNRELIDAGKETSTSPKKPEQVPAFMELYNKAFIFEDDETDAATMDTAQHAVDLAQRENEQRSEPAFPTGVESKEPQIIGGVEDDEDETFEGQN